MSKMIELCNGETRAAMDGDCTIAVMGKVGDHKQTWNPQNTVEVAAAKATYDKLRSEGYLAFSVNEDGTKGQQMTGWDPTAAKIIMSPQMRGG